MLGQVMEAGVSYGRRQYWETTYIPIQVLSNIAFLLGTSNLERSCR